MASKDSWNFTEDDLTSSEEFEDEQENLDVPLVIPRPKAQTLIGTETFLRGELNARRAIEVEGGFRGSIECQEAIMVNPNGRVEGELNANLVIIEGRVKGVINPRRCLMIQGEGLFIGDLRCQPELLVLSEKATFCSEAAYQAQAASPAGAPSATNESEPDSNTLDDMADGDEGTDVPESGSASSNQPRQIIPHRKK